MNDFKAQDPQEGREVRVADPNLSADANQRLTAEVRDVVGADHVRVPVDRPHPSRGQEKQSRGLRALLSRLTRAHERPDPTTVALLEEEGIRNPEQHFSDLVDEFTEPTDDDDSEERTSEAHDQPGHAASEQQSAMTPTSGPSQSVGPGSDN